MAKNYRNLKVWQKSLDLVDGIYETLEYFPKTELYSLSSQLRRAAVSIPSNIAEGSGRGGEKEFVQFIKIAKGSLAELETQLIISKRRGYVNNNQFDSLMQRADEVDRMLYSLQNKIKNTDS